MVGECMRGPVQEQEVPVGVEFALSSPVHEGGPAFGVMLQHGDVQEAHGRWLLQHQARPSLQAPSQAI
jgi:hypothetical protein